MLRYAGLIASGVFSLYVSELVQPFAENHPWRVSLTIAAVALVAGLAWLVMLATEPDSEEDAGEPEADDSWRSLIKVVWIVPVGIVLAGCGWGALAGWDARDNYLTPYCEYGAASEEAAERCLEDVNSADVDALDTPAAQYARGEIADCGRGAGPLCR